MENNISLVVPTYNRCDALRINLPMMLELEGIGEVIVVDDGSVDQTTEVINEVADDRVRGLRHESNRGVMGARRTGVAGAREAWILFGEDDCKFPSDYARRLLEEAETHNADIVGAPWLNAMAVTDASVAEIAMSRPRRPRPGLDEVGVFPLTSIDTPLLPAPALVRKQVFAKVDFFDGYRVNGFREETDFFVQAARTGHRCVLTPDTYSYQTRRWQGGQYGRSTLRYEYWAMRNNWLFLQRHGAWLSEHGYIGSSTDAQYSFIAKRMLRLATGTVLVRASRFANAAGRRCSKRRVNSHLESI